MLLDCPPSLGVLTVAALTAAQGVLIPLQCETLSHRGAASCSTPCTTYGASPTASSGSGACFPRCTTDAPTTPGRCSRTSPRPTSSTSSSRRSRSRSASPGPRRRTVDPRHRPKPPWRRRVPRCRHKPHGTTAAPLHGSMDATVRSAAEHPSHRAAVRRPTRAPLAGNVLGARSAVRSERDPRRRPRRYRSDPRGPRAGRRGDLDNGRAT